MFQVEGRGNKRVGEDGYSGKDALCMDFCLDLIGRNWEGWETVLLFFKFYNKKAREKLSSSQIPLSVTSREHFRLEAQLVQRLKSKCMCVPAIFPGPTQCWGTVSTRQTLAG